MREAMCAAGLPGIEEAIAACAVEPHRLLGYIEVHIEQGPVLLERGLPVGVVTSIAGNVLRDLARELRRARARKRPIIWGLGAHVLKVGLSPLLIDLMDRGYVSYNFV